MEVTWHYVYVLYSLKDKKLYIGYTTNLKNRVKQHNDGINTSTKPRRPLKLIHAESYLNEKDARKQETYYKTGRGRETIKKKLNHTFAEL